MDSSGNKTNNIVSVDKFGNISLLDIGKQHSKSLWEVTILW